MSWHHALFVAALLIPLSIDTFIVSAVLGVAGLPKKDRLKTSLVLTAFEAGMPVIGVIIGRGLGALVGHYANYLAALVIGAAGLLMIIPGKSEAKEEQELQLLARTRGFSIIGLGISISLDELAIGLSLGLVHIPLAVAVVFIDILAFMAARGGLWIGGKLSERFREGAEKIGGLILIIVAIILVISRLGGHQL